jgi:hypothetical protein
MPKLKTLSRESILTAAPPLAFETVEVPEWNVVVTVREMTGSERDSWEASILGDDGRRSEEAMTNARAKLVVRSVVDDDGARVFGDADIEAVGALSARGLNRVFEVACRLSGLTSADVEDLTKN